MATVAGVFQRNNMLPSFVAFLAQVVLAASVELADDLGRAVFAQHGTVQGIKNADKIISFEAAHGFFVEPAWQIFFEKTHHVFILTVSWLDVAQFMNGVYVLCHIFVTVGVAAWVYFYRRQYFRVMRNTVIVANILALAIYENFPVAPPRLMPPVPFAHHLFTFQDTMYGVLSSGGRIVGSNITYNEFSAMPSIHMAWALVVAAAVVLLARPLLIKVLGALYPALMLVSVVVTGNHFFLDALGAVGVVMAAAGISIGFELVRSHGPWGRAESARLTSTSSA